MGTGLVRLTLSALKVPVVVCSIVLFLQVEFSPVWHVKTWPILMTMFSDIEIMSQPITSKQDAQGTVILRRVWIRSWQFQQMTAQCQWLTRPPYKPIVLAHDYLTWYHTSLMCLNTWNFPPEIRTEEASWMRGQISSTYMRWSQLSTFNFFEIYRLRISTNTQCTVFLKAKKHHKGSRWGLSGRSQTSFHPWELVWSQHLFF